MVNKENDDLLYCIKTIWGPNAYNYPRKNNIIKFTYRSTSDRFKKCKGFFLYETGKKENKKVGKKTIYAYGILDKDQTGKELNKIEIKDKKKFGWGARVIIKKKDRKKTENGIPISKLRELGINQFQVRGGVIRISEKQFNNLKKKFDKIKNLLK